VRRERVNRLGDEIDTEALSACDAAECAWDRACKLCARRDSAHTVMFIKHQEFVDCHSPQLYPELIFVNMLSGNSRKTNHTVWNADCQIFQTFPLH
jgi:hypothetical protein